MIDKLLSGGLFGLLSSVADKVWPDPVERDKAKAAILQAEIDGRLREGEQQLSAILAEAQSADPWTSRARPTFLYVMYLLILTAIPMGGLAAWDAALAGKIAEGMRAWLAAIPEPMWWLFGAGYTGYTAGRSFDKWRQLRGG